MGLTRQSVHTTVDRLLADGLVELHDNADHRRSQLVELTEHGRTTYAALDAKQATWVNALSAELTPKELETARRVVAELCARLEADNGRPTPQEGERDDR